MEDGTEGFGQVVSLTKRIRGILQGYPEGTAIFKELLQNAEDAGATEVPAFSSFSIYFSSMNLLPAGSLIQTVHHVRCRDAELPCKVQHLRGKRGGNSEP
jgi:hypothetical protein